METETLILRDWLDKRECNEIHRLKVEGQIGTDLTFEITYEALICIQKLRRKILGQKYRQEANSLVVNIYNTSKPQLLLLYRTCNPTGCTHLHIEDRGDRR